MNKLRSARYQERVDNAFVIKEKKCDDCNGCGYINSWVEPGKKSKQDVCQTCEGTGKFQFFKGDIRHG